MRHPYFTSKKKLIRISTVPISLNTFLKGQLKMLAEYYDVLAVSSPGEALEEVHRREGVRIKAVPMERHISFVKDLVALCRLIVLFLRERPDIVHSMTPKAGLLAMLAAWVTRVPVRMHTFTGLVFPTATGLKQKILIATDRLTCFCATHINPEGRGVKHDLIKYKITSKPLHIIANGNVNGINLNYFDRTPEVMELAVSIRRSGVFTFCFIGRMVTDKGINELVQAFKRLYEKNKQVCLLLVGPFENALDPLQPETEEAILHHPGIRFMDFQKDVRPFLAASDALVFPSYREGFPNVVLQAGAMGLPAIVTDINGCNEIICSGQNGTIIPARDKDILLDTMEYYVAHPTEVKRMADQARQLIVERYDQHIVWEALLKEYETLLGALDKRDS